MRRGIGKFFNISGRVSVQKRGVIISVGQERREGRFWLLSPAHGEFLFTQLKNENKMSNVFYQR